MALVGRSGAGKTTVLKLVNRLLLPQAGHVLVEGKDTRDWDPIRLRRAVGYVIQDVGLFPHMSVGSNIAVVPRLEAWSADRVAARVTELLELIGLSPELYAGAGRTSCRAGSVSASAWRGRWRPIRRCC